MLAVAIGWPGVLVLVGLAANHDAPVVATPAPTPLAPPPAPSPSSPSPPVPTSPAASPTPSGSPSEPEPERGTALYALAGLEVKGRAPKTGYDRDLFGSGWIDTNHNSCSTRDDILRRDLRPITVLAGTKGCEVIKGTLSDPYTSDTISFPGSAGTSEEIEIDHIVALSDAWQKSAQQWSRSQRIRFANDALELLATGGAVNAAKSDGDTATWLPPNKPYGAPSWPGRSASKPGTSCGSPWPRRRRWPAFWLPALLSRW